MWEIHGLEEERAAAPRYVAFLEEAVFLVALFAAFEVVDAVPDLR